MMNLGIQSGKIEWKAGRKRIKKARRKSLLRLKMRHQFHQNSRWKKCSKFNEICNTFFSRKQDKTCIGKLKIFRDLTKLNLREAIEEINIVPST